MSALEHTPELYRAIVETAAEGIWVVDANERTTFVNPKLAEMLGCEPEAMIGQTPFAFMDDEWADVAAESFERQRQGNREDLSSSCSGGRTARRSKRP